jgi:hypothetical protein
MFLQICSKVIRFSGRHCPKSKMAFLGLNELMSGLYAYHLYLAKMRSEKQAVYDLGAAH